MSYLNRLLRKAVFGVTSVVTVLSLSLPAIAAPTEDVISGTTSVQLSADLVNALTSLQVRPAAVGFSRLRRGVASFPITGGAIDLGTVKTEIIHNGGLSLTAGNVVVELTDFVITTLDDRPVLTGLLIANGELVARAPLFELGLPAVTPPLRPARGRIIEIPDVQVTLTAAAATALNQAFGVTAFTQGFNIGTARVRAVVQDH